VLFRSLEASPVQDVAFAADGRTLTAATGDGLVHTWSAADGQLERTVRAAGPWTRVAIGPGGRAIASVGVADGLRLIRLRSDRRRGGS